ncbi:hypothetical protein [uncultured Methylobacterium sp.]|uniref:hypothetical protein n=1 Tax=uncultured Methylobacterium sp. TaxID=157278 RepID=UPI002597FFFF|nr:hypothetical protein [uncultured Methylobacterium sp.]
MRLYHFTSLGHLPVILATGGLWRGEVPIGDGTESLRGTWFTSDPDGAEHGLDGSGVDKRAVRIVVVFPRGDRRVEPWLKLARKITAPEYIATLVASGGGKRKAETWYVCPAQIPPEQFRLIELRGSDGRYAPATPEQIAALVAHDGLYDEVVEDFCQMRIKAGRAA